MPQHVDRDVLAEVVGAQFVECAAQLVGDLQALQLRDFAKQPAVVGRDAELGAALVDGLEHGDKILPDRARIVGIAVLIGVCNRAGRQELAVLGEGEEEHAIEDSLRVGEEIA